MMMRAGGATEDEGAVRDVRERGSMGVGVLQLLSQWSHVLAVVVAVRARQMEAAENVASS